MNKFLQNKNLLKALLSVLLISGFGVTNLHSQSVPTGAINGVFSVSENNAVCFSRGNLQYKASTNKWQFATHQYDFVGAANSNISSTYTGWIDTFGWGTSGYNHGATCYQPWSTSTSNSDYYAYGSDTYNLFDQTGEADWGYNAISNGGNQENSGWRTLTKDEWSYLFNTRTTASGTRYAKAQVNDVNGVILLPDNWSNSTYSLNNTNISDANFTSNTIGSTEWNTLENAGVVFLPAATLRMGTFVFDLDNTSWSFYWSASSCGSDCAWGVAIWPEFLDPASSTSKYYGLSVRLVCPLDLENYSIQASPNPAEGGAVSGAGAYFEGTECKLTATASAGYTFAYWTENGEVVSTDAEYTFTVSGNRDIVAHFTLVETIGRLNGQFTVGENAVVFFSQGNLQYQASTNKWQFAENQYDYIGSANSNISSTYTGWIDLFGWGTSGYNHGAVCYQPWSTSEIGRDYYVYGNYQYNLFDQTGQADWGYNAISNGGNQVNSGWRTLTKDEWAYLFNTRVTSSGIRYAKATVNNKNGVILLPDDWSIATYTLSNTNSANAAFTSNTISSTQWNILEDAGAVFLPVTGYRGGTPVTVNNIGSNGYYWSASYYTTNHAWHVGFGSSYLYTSNTFRSYGFSVRLVRSYQNCSINATPSPAEGGAVSGAGAYLVGTECTLTATASAGYTFAYWTENGEVVSPDAEYPFAVTGDRTLVANFTQNGSTGKLNGQFTVGENAVVCFSQGNLQYRASTNQWQFAANQYDYICSANSNISSTYTGWIDLFGWGTSGYNHGANCYQPWSTSESSSDYYAYGNYTYNLYDQTGQADWGYNAISNGGNQENSGWRTLTKDEWDYVFYTRVTASGIRYAKAQVNSMNGVILLPDDWQTSYYSLTSTNDGLASFSANVITATQWATLEQHGAVFLPAAGYRYGTSVNYVGSGGNYWSASYNNYKYAYNVGFDDRGLSTSVDVNYRYSGFSVRLVCPVGNCFIQATPSPAEGGAVSGAGAYMAGAGCTLTATASAGYHFVNWTEGGTQVSTNASYQFTVTGDRTLVANFSPNVYTVTLNTNGGTINSGNVTSYIYGVGATLPTVVTRTGYTFEGWYDNAGLTGSAVTTISTTATGNKTYWAKWTANTYTVTLNTNGGTINSGNVTSYTYGVGATLPTNVTRTGYTFGGWYENSGLTGSSVTTISTTATGNKSFWAKWTANTYTVTLNANGGTINSGNFTSYTYGVGATLPTDVTRTGYTFGGWYANSGLTGSAVTTISTTATGDKTFWAKWTANVYTVTLNTNGGTINSGNVTSYTYGVGATLPTDVTRIGYTFGGWYANSGLTGSAVTSISTTATGNKTYWAKWTANTYTVTLNTNSGTINSGNVTSYTYGVGATLPTDVTRTGYTFGGWYDNSGLTGSAVTSISTTATGNKTFWAKWTINSYSINASANPTAGGTVSGAGTYNHGSSCTLTATPATGYNFTKWTKNGSQVSTSATYTFTVSGTGSYVAQFTKKTYAITATSNPTAGGSITGAGTYEHGSNVTLTATAATGYTFVKWTKNGTQVSTNASYSFTATAAGEYVAHFSLNSYAITASSNPAAGGTVTGAGTYDHFATCTLTATAATGYSFVNWTESGTQVSTNASYQFTVSGTRTLVANFSPNTYSVTLNTNGGTINSGNVTSYTYGVGATLPTNVTRTGYTFDGWYDNAGLTGSAVTAISTTATGNKTYWAKWTANTYTVTLNTNSGTINSGNVTSYTYGVGATLPTDVTRTGYTFGGWYDNSGLTGSAVTTISTTATGNKTFWAKWTINSYAITATANPTAGGTVSGAGTYNHGSNVTLTATAATGYTFVKWTKNGTQVSTNASYSFTATAAGEYVAHFSLNSYAITASANPTEGGTITGAGTIDHFSTCTLTATAATGYTFVNWTENGTEVSTDATYSFAVAGPRTLVANFSLNSYSITVVADPTAGGTVTGAGTYNHGENVTLTAHANTGYTFVNWTKDGATVSTDATYSFTVTEPGAYAAHFSLNSYEVLTAADPEEGGTVTGAGTYNYGESCTITATANEGYTFDHWSDGYVSEYFTIESLEDDNTITLTIGSAVTSAQLTYVAWSKDKTNWNVTNIDDTEQVISVPANANEKVYWKGEGTNYASGYNNATQWSIFSATGLHKVYGNIASLLFGDDFEEVTALPSSPNVGRNYQRMFYGDTNLTDASNLLFPFTTIQPNCFASMFLGCTNLIQGPRMLPAMTMREYCYANMFENCTSLTRTPDLPATTLAYYCYSCMFKHCHSLVETTELPALVCTSRCYWQMFAICSSLTTAPKLPATTLNYLCYGTMFAGTAITEAPELPVTTLSGSCYQYMFQNCKSLTKAPVLPATVLTESCYKYMFDGCNSLDEVTCLATDISATDCTLNWLGNVSASGTFHKADDMNDWPTGASGIPSGWITEDADETDYAAEYFTIESLEDDNTITLTIGSAVTSAQLTYVAWSKDKVNWMSTTVDDTEQVISVPANAHEKVYWKGEGNAYASGNNADQKSSFSSIKSINARGNIASLIFDDGFVGQTSLSSVGARTFQSLFNGCTTLISAKNLVLPFSALNNACYTSMFSGCSSLVAVPQLPATTLTVSGYAGMFRDCTSLTSAPVLPATTLDNYCYENMFRNCTSLTQAPILPATTLANYCYTNMFNGCTSLVTAPDILATAGGGQQSLENMFYGCTSLLTAPTELSLTTLGRLTYHNMFYGCTSLVTAPVISATRLNVSCCLGMFQNCRSLTKAPVLLATTLTETCYRNMFSGCTSLNEITCLATDISATDCLLQWTQNVASTGTFHKAADMNDWPTGVSGIPSGWTVFDATPVNPTEPSFTYTVTDDQYWLAHFTLNNYEINASANPTESGTVTGAGTYNHFDNCTLTATANTGYTFQNWTLDGDAVSSDAEYTFQVSGAGDYVANFSLNSYAITATTDPTAGGTVAGAGTYNHGETVTLTVTVNEGYVFDGWTKAGEEVSTDLSISFTATEAGSYVAHLTHLSYPVEVTAFPVEGGTVTGAGTYYHGDQCALTASPNASYLFVSWLRDGAVVSTNPSYSFEVTGPATFVANFMRYQFDVTVSADPNEAGTVTGGGVYSYGSTATVTATANEGYEFVSWTENGTEVSTDAAYSFTVVGNSALVAHFQLGSESHEFTLGLGWSWWSTYIEMNGIDGLGLLEAALGDNATQIKSQNRFLLYENNVWDGNLTALANEQMYRLYTVEDGAYAINGQYADPAEHTVNLKKGWNWIGYVESVPMEHNTAMANLATAAENDCLKSYNHFATYYEGYGWYGDLEVMEPGLGYMLRVANRGSFTYASVDKGTVINISQPEVNSYWKPVTGKFPDNMNVLAVIELNGDELRAGNVELAAFAENGECRGTALLRYVAPIDRYAAFLTVYGEDGDALRFLVRHEDATYQVNERLIMVVDEVVGKGTEPYKMTVNGAGIDEISAGLNLYPNPVGQGQEVRVELPETLGNATVEVIDVMGRTVLRNTVDGRDGACAVSTANVPGVYTIRVTGEQGRTWYGKLIVK